MKLTRLIVLMCSASMLGTLANAQSPWTKDKGAGYAQLSLMAIPTYDEIFVGGLETTALSRELSELGLQFYGEYGIIDGTTVIVDAPFKILSSGKEISPSVLEEGTEAVPGNLRLGVRQKLYSDAFAAAVQLTLELPTSKYDNPTGLRTGYDALTILPTVSIGSGFGKGYAYAYGGVGFRTNEYSTYFNGGIEGGYKFFDRLWTMLFFDVVSSFKNGERIDPPNNVLTGFYLNDQGWASFGLKLLFEINDKMGVNASSTVGILGANNVPASPSVAIGFYTKWGEKSE